MGLVIRSCCGTVCLGSIYFLQNESILNGKLPFRKNSGNLLKLKSVTLIGEITMRRLNLITTLITTLVISTISFAGDRYNQNNRGHSNNRSTHHSNNSNRSRSHQQHGNRHGNKHGNRHGNKHNNKHYNSRSNNGYYGFNSPYRSSHNNNGQHNNHRQYNKRSYKKHRSYNNYNNYQPYSNDRYRYRPLRGLGHYFYRDNYGYGHWHDNMWCDINHSQSYYSNYYANYPYAEGWVNGDGDYGLSFYLH